MIPVLQPIWIVLLSLAMAALAIRSIWRHQEVARGKRIALVILRLGLLICVASILFGPVTVRQQTPPNERTRVVLLVDASRSMEVADVEGAPRLEAAQAAATRLQGAFSEKGIETDLWAFARDARRASPDDTLPVMDGQTDLARAFETVAASYGANPPAAVVLLSDGIHVAASDPLAATDRLRAQAITLFASGYGGEVHPPDIRLECPRMRQVSFVGQEFTIPLRVHSTGLPPQALRVTLGPAVGQAPGTGVTQTETLRVPQDGVAEAAFMVTHEKKGFYMHPLEVEAAQGEYDLANNRLYVALTILDESIKMLLLEGAPHWDSKFFAQYARGDPHVNLTSITRLRAGKFFRVDESTGTHEGLSDQSGMPRTEEALNQYDVIVLGKSIDGLLEGKDVMALRNFVTKRGGTLVFLRGRSSNGFFPELAALEPVEWGTGQAREYRIEVTDLGRAIGAFHFGLDEPLEKTLATLPPLEKGNAVRRLKSFTDVHASFMLPGGKSTPALMSRRFGKGMILMINGEGLWRWGFPPLTKARYKDSYNHFFGVLVRWAATQADFLPGQDFLLRTSRSLVRPEEPLVFTLSSRLDEKALVGYRPMLSIRKAESPSDAPPLRRLEPAQTDSTRVWSAVASLQDPGRYILRLENNVGKPKTLEIPLGVLPRRQEATDLSANDALLARLCEAGGGALLAAEEIPPRVMDTIDTEREEVRQMYETVEPAWNHLWLLVVMVVLAFCEWALRRREGLA